jgi:hypothetical protein
MFAACRSDVVPKPEHAAARETHLPDRETRNHFVNSTLMRLLARRCVHGELRNKLYDEARSTRKTLP